MWVCCIYMLHHVFAWSPQSPIEGVGSQLHMVVTMWAMGTEPRSSVGAACALKCRATSPAQFLLVFKFQSVGVLQIGFKICKCQVL